MLPRLLCLCLLLQGQNNPPVIPPVIKVTTRQVQISVVVHDKKGQPVADLKKEDFTVFDKGEPQQIRYFAMETDQAPTAPPAKLPPGVFANRTLTAAGQSVALPNALTVVLIDSLNSDVIGRAMARNGLIKFLGQLQPGDRVAIYSLSDGLHVIHEFTSDLTALMQAVTKRSTGSAAVDASSYDDSNTGDPELDDLINRASGQISNYYQERRTETTLQALRTIANHLAGVPGRKNLVWLSAGFPLFVGQGRDLQTNDSLAQQTIRALNDALVAIYPVDIRGLMTHFDFMPSMAQGTAPSGQRMPPIPGRSGGDRRATDAIRASQETMFQVADRTGGRAFMNNNDIGGSIRRAIADTTVSYTLSYTPTHNEWDGRYREVKVKVDRPGVEIRYRNGYYATADGQEDAKVRATAMLAARDSALLSTGLGVAAQVQQFPTADARRVKVRIVIDGSGVSFTQDASGMWHGEIDILTAVRDRQGATLKEAGDHVNLPLKDDEHRKILKTGLPLSADVEAPAGAAWTRVIVRDSATGAVGSVDLPLVK